MTIATTAAAAQTVAAPAASSDNALAKLSGDYTMFLKLLTTQMTNQDPLNPMDTSQYTQQLVQYSQVEQSIQQSATLKDILARLSSQDMIQTSSLIGRTVSYNDPSAGLTATAPAQWSWTSDRPPASLTASISDANGTIVDVRTLDPASGAFSWDGILANGARARDGSYTLSLNGLDNLGTAIPNHITGVGIVQGVSLRDNILSMTVNGQSFTASSLQDVMIAGG